jgi:hypothetical protein
MYVTFLYIVGYHYIRRYVPPNLQTMTPNDKEAALVYISVYLRLIRIQMEA